MKIVIVLGPFYALPPDGCGAVERVWYELSHAYSAAGHDVVLIGKGRPGGNTPAPGTRVKVVALPGYSATGNIWIDLLKDFAWGLQVRRLLEDVDVLVTNSFWLPVVMRFGMTRARRIMVHVARFPKHQMWLYTSADAIQAISTAVANEVVRQCPELKTKMAVLPYPIDRSVFAPPAAARDYSSTLTLLYAGRLHPEKGVHLLVEAFGHLVARGRPATLRLVGPASTELGGGGPRYLDRLKELAHGFPVEFVPPISDSPTLARQYQNAHCFCYPSLAEKGEAFGLAVLEAMATGLPVVVSDLACFKDFIEPGIDGLAFDHRARFPVEELARALDKVVGDPSFAMQLGERAVTKAERYAYDRVAARYVALVESLRVRTPHARDALNMSDCAIPAGMLQAITPVVITHDEERNVGRTLEKLRWASDVVLVDSGSRDSTLAIAGGFPNVRAFHRKFDNHAAQWTYAVRETSVTTDWVLALDADYMLSDAFVDELRGLAPPEEVSGYEARFVYCIHGKPLRGTLYPPVTVLFRRECARYVQDGHTHRVRIEGTVARLQSPIYHDDRKPISRWLASQRRYMRLEADKLVSADFAALSWPDKVRRLRFIAPGAVMLYCLFWKGLILDGPAGISYTLQRVYAELLLSFYLLRNDVAALRRLRPGRP